MKRILPGVLFLLAMMMLASCNDYETYAEQKEKERDAINKFISDSSITVISEAQFKEKGYTTDVSKNEYVLFNGTGVYMQIIRKGCGEEIKSGESLTVLCRFSEKNILTDSLLLTNDVLYYTNIVDKMTVTRSSDTFTASFISGVMYSWYSSSSVPAGWLVPLLYIKVGRPEKEGDEIAKVKLIVPHTQGQSSATQNVYPCYYVITYMRGL